MNAPGPAHRSIAKTSDMGVNGHFALQNFSVTHGAGSRAAVASKPMAQPVCPQLRKCVVRAGTYASLQADRTKEAAN